MAETYESLFEYTIDGTTIFKVLSLLIDRNLFTLKLTHYRRQHKHANEHTHECEYDLKENKIQIHTRVFDYFELRFAQKNNT